MDWGGGHAIYWNRKGVGGYVSYWIRWEKRKEVDKGCRYRGDSKTPAGEGNGRVEITAGEIVVRKRHLRRL